MDTTFRKKDTRSKNLSGEIDLEREIRLSKFSGKKIFGADFGKFTFPR